MKEYNVENICGYTVHSYYVESPYKIKESKKTSGKRKNTILRYFAFAAIAPFALFADAVIAIFKLI
jgi:hypothetical protein